MAAFAFLFAAARVSIFFLVCCEFGTDCERANGWKKMELKCCWVSERVLSCLCIMDRERKRAVSKMKMKMVWRVLKIFRMFGSKLRCVV